MCWLIDSLWSFILKTKVNNLDQQIPEGWPVDGQRSPPPSWPPGVRTRWPSREFPQLPFDWLHQPFSQAEETHIGSEIKAPLAFCQPLLCASASPFPDLPWVSGCLWPGHLRGCVPAASLRPCLRRPSSSVGADLASHYYASQGRFPSAEWFL